MNDLHLFRDPLDPREASYLFSQQHTEPSNNALGTGLARTPKVLVMCEFSDAVRSAFEDRGFDAYSCDLLQSESRDAIYHCKHIQAEHDLDYLDIIEAIKPDLMIAFPPCTALAVSGARWFEIKRQNGQQEQAINFFLSLASAPVKRIAIENPIGIMSRKYRKPDQIIQPWQFGHGETKATCLWLKNLPKLQPTNIVEGRKARVHREPPSPDRWKNRSRTLRGIAEAMADQWGKVLV